MKTYLLFYVISAVLLLFSSVLPAAVPVFGLEEAAGLPVPPAVLAGSENLTADTVEAIANEANREVADWLQARSAREILEAEGPRLRAAFSRGSEREQFRIISLLGVLRRKITEEFPEPVIPENPPISNELISRGCQLLFYNRDIESGLTLLLLEGGTLNASALIYLDILYFHGMKNADGGELIPPFHEPIRNFWIRMADEGMPRAHLTMGMAYMQGQGVEKDVGKGLDLLEKSALEEAWMVLAAYFYDHQDMDQAMFWWRLAALKADNEEAWYNLGVASQGRKKYWEALDALQNALRVNPEYHVAKIEISRLYIEGWGVDRDLDRAEALLREVLATGREHLHLHGYADFNLGAIAQRRREPGVNVSRSRFRKFRQNAGEGDPEAMREFGLMLLKGFEGLEPRLEAALHWLSRAAEEGDVVSMRELGVIRLDGVEGSISPEPDAGIVLLRKAAVQGNSEAQFRIGSLCLTGKYLEQDLEQGQNLYRQSAAQGYPRAMMYLGIRLREGRGMEMDVEAGVQWIRRAAETGYADALMMLVLILKQSETEDHNPFDVYVWSTLAIRAGKLELQSLRDEVAQELSDEEWARARIEVEERFRKSMQFNRLAE